jgi:hypothetical protein
LAASTSAAVRHAFPDPIERYEEMMRQLFSLYIDRRGCPKSHGLVLKPRSFGPLAAKPSTYKATHFGADGCSEDLPEGIVVRLISRNRASAPHRPNSLVATARLHHRVAAPSPLGRLSDFPNQSRDSEEGTWTGSRN